MLHALIMAGGGGTRFWPRSRQKKPKQFLTLTGDRSLLQQTVDRLRPLTGPGGVVVVTGAQHADAVTAQLPELGPENLLAEPSPRDSAAAIALAAAVVARRRPGAIVGSFAADHVVRDQEAFCTAVREAVATARAGYVVTIGIEPDRPATAFGYIQAGSPLDLAAAPSAHAVRTFVEKPDADTAAAYLAEGGYRWNAGMFVARADVLLGELARHRPALHAGIQELAAAWDTPRRPEALDTVWPTLEKVAIDYAVAEPAAAAGRVAVVPASFGWDDVGDFAALATLLPPDAEVRVLGDGEHVIAHEASGVAVPGRGRLLAVLGLDDVVVVDTPDAVLVTTRARAQDVKGVVDALRALGRHDVL
jgi:mannose-1-phosphate guanylyltransferase